MSQQAGILIPGKPAALTAQSGHLLQIRIQVGQTSNQIRNMGLQESVAAGFLKHGTRWSFM